MQGNEFQKRALETVDSSDSMLLLQGVMGMCGEAGEACELLKKKMFQGHPLDKEHVAKEIGDVLWYAAVTAHALGYTLDEIMEMNIEKREKRYRGEFSVEKSLNRKEGDI